MRISKIFRKYSRVLLLVFMSMLLVVFLVGDVISRASRNRGMEEIEIGQAFGQPVYNDQLLMAKTDVDLTRQLGLWTPALRAKDAHQQNIADCLLIEEARRAGITVGRDEIIRYFQNNPKAAAILNGVHKRGNRSLNSVYDAIGRVQSVRNLAMLQAGGAQSASLPELELAYRDRTQNARVLLSVIDSKAFLANVATPEESELEALFEEGKDRDPTPSEEELVFGYRLPDRVRVEYLTIDPTEITAGTHVSKKEARAFYDDNMSKYMKTVTDDSTFKIDQGKPQKVQMTYEEVADRVREDCRAAKAVRVAQRMVNEMQEEASRPWLTTTADEQGVRPAPADDQQVSFADLQKRFSTDGPVQLHKTDLVDADTLARERGFARAQATFDRRPVPASMLAFRVEGLASADDGISVPVLRVNEPSPVLIEMRSVDGQQVPYQAYFFRVVEVAPAGPPAKLDDVRTKLTADAKKLKAFELGREQAEKLTERAREVGLEQAVAEADELRVLIGEPDEPASTQPAPPIAGPALYLQELKPTEPKRFLRLPTSLPNIGRVAGLHKAVFALADEADSTAEHRVTTAPDAERLKWVVAELLEVSPVYQGDFETNRDQLEQQVAQFQTRMVLGRWFSIDNIFKRAGFIETQPEQQ